MEALAHLEAIGYKVEFHADETQDMFWVKGINNEILPETVWQYVDQHKEEIRQALRSRKAEVMTLTEEQRAALLVGQVHRSEIAIESLKSAADALKEKGANATDQDLDEWNILTNAIAELETK